MKILVCELPASDWWGRGMPAYEHNWLMRQSRIPRPDIVRAAHKRFVNELRNVSQIVTLPFPKQFDIDGSYKHDFIFVRDSFVSAGDGSVIISNFSERGRQDEAEFMKSYFASLGIVTHELSEDAHAEGGEFYLLDKEKIIFAGLTRNNQKGIDEVAGFAGIEKVCVVKNPGFHLDTNFSVLLSADGSCAGVVACMSVIENREDVSVFCQNNNLPILELDPVDGIGAPEAPGSFAANCLALPGILIGSAQFQTPGAEEKIGEMGIRHLVTPLEDLMFSGGAAHCLTNELYGDLMI